MSVTIESLEGRTLLSASDISAVSADYLALVSDATALKSEVAAAYTTYKADVKTLTADIKALPKSKTNTADVAALKKATTAAGALEVRVAAKVYSVGKADLNKARAAFLTDVKKPTVANTNKLNAAIATLGTVLAAPEAQLAADVATGDTNVSADLSALVAANPSDTQLATDVSTAESQQTRDTATVTAEVSTLNADLTTLIDDIG